MSGKESVGPAIGSPWHAEGHDVRCQDTQNRNAANQIETGDALCRCRWGCDIVLAVRCCLILCRHSMPHRSSSTDYG